MTTPPIPTLPPEVQVVRIRNTGTEPWTGEYASNRYTIPVAGEVVVPFLAMCLWLGHPDAMDVPGDRQRQFRTDEFERLGTRYGVYENAWREATHPQSKYREDPEAEGKTEWDMARPSLDAFDINNVPIITVADDPQGEHLAPDALATAQARDTAATMTAMQQQIATLQAQIAALNADPSTPVVALPPEHGQTADKAVAPTAQPGPGPVPSGVEVPDLTTGPVGQPVQPSPVPPEDRPQVTKVV